MDVVENAYSLERHVEGEPRGLAAPLHLIEIAREAEELHRLRPHSGHLAKTLVKLPGLRVVLLSLVRGARLAEHRTDGPFTLQVLSGRASLRIGGRRIDLSAGQWLSVASGLAHDVEAAEDSQLLLTVGA